MNTKNMWIAVFSGAALTTLVSNVPFVEMVNILCFAGFWGGAIFAVWFYRRLSGELTTRQGVRIGLLTGLFAGVLGFVLSFLGVSGLQGLVNELGAMAPSEGDSIPLWGAIVFNILGVVFNILFGTIGGWIGSAIFRTDRVPRNPSSTQMTK
jgi:hypothetical protein